MIDIDIIWAEGLPEEQGHLDYLGLIEQLGDERLSTIYRLHYCQGEESNLTFAAIGRQLGISRQRTHIQNKKINDFVIEIEQGKSLEETTLYQRRHKAIRTLGEQGVSAQERAEKASIRRAEKEAADRERAARRDVRQHAKVLAAQERTDTARAKYEARWKKLNIYSRTEVNLARLDNLPVLLYGFKGKHLPDFRCQVEKVMAAKLGLSRARFLELSDQPGYSWYATLDSEKLDKDLEDTYGDKQPILILFHGINNDTTYDDALRSIVTFDTLARSIDGENIIRHNRFIARGQGRYFKGERRYICYSGVREKQIPRSINSRVNKARQLIDKSQGLLRVKPKIFDL